MDLTELINLIEKNVEGVVESTGLPSNFKDSDKILTVKGKCVYELRFLEPNMKIIGFVKNGLAYEKKVNEEPKYLGKVKYRKNLNSIP